MAKFWPYYRNILVSHLNQFPPVDIYHKQKLQLQLDLRCTVAIPSPIMLQAKFLTWLQSYGQEFIHKMMDKFICFLMLASSIRIFLLFKNT